MSARYSDADCQAVRQAVDFLIDGRDNQFKVAAAIEHANHPWHEHLNLGGWYKAAYYLLDGQHHNPGAMQILLRYFPYSIRYAAQRVGKAVELSDPDGYSGAPGVNLHVDWQLSHNRGSIEDAIDHAHDGEWHEAASDFVEGQRHNADISKLYLTYFPHAIRYAAERLNRSAELRIDDPVFIRTI